MSAPVFLDTAGWFAALSPKDQHHGPASAYYRAALGAGDARFVTTNLVVAEMHVLLTRRAGAEVGIAFLDHLYMDPAHDVVFVTREIEREASDRWLRPFADHPFSLTDAVSFEVMRAEGLKTAFTFDQHFAVAGYAMVPT